jgi:hypothetical protein
MATPIPPLDTDEADRVDRHLQSVKPQGQLGFDEELVEDDELEQALEHRLQKKVAADQARKAYDEADERAKAKLENLEVDLDDDNAIRVGRFRITRRSTSARSVSFETKPSTRIRITLVGDD